MTFNKCCSVARYRLGSVISMLTKHWHFVFFAVDKINVSSMSSKKI